MDSLPTAAPGRSAGRRHGRNGTVTVAELIKRHPLPARHEELADELLAGPQRPENPPPPPAARIAIGVFALFLLCVAAVGAASIITFRPHSPTPWKVAAEPIRGALALRPDLVRESRWPFLGNGGFEVADSASAQATYVAPPEAGGPLAAANPDVGSNEAAVRFVTAFYHRLDNDPEQAVNLLAPSVVGTHRSELIKVWKQIAAVEVTIVSAPPKGPIVAEVVAIYAQGDRVLLRHRLAIEPGASPKITAAELVRARHLPH